MVDLVQVVALILILSGMLISMDGLPVSGLVIGLLKPRSLQLVSGWKFMATAS